MDEAKICTVLFCRGLNIKEISDLTKIGIRTITRIVRESDKIHEIGDKYWVPPVLQLDLNLANKSPYKPKKIK